VIAHEHGFTVSAVNTIVKGATCMKEHMKIIATMKMTTERHKDATSELGKTVDNVDGSSDTEMFSTKLVDNTSKDKTN
jgi:hypothetical protein